jgi:hypothetical protein
MHDKRVKDKCIHPGTVLFVAIVDFFQDTPYRDEDESIEEVFETLVLAQKFLATFPRDVWDGYASTDFKYVEKDENVRKRNSRKTRGNPVRPARNAPNLGRTFARSD